MAFDPIQRRAALKQFLKDNKKLKVFPWSERADLAEATLRGFIAGRSRTLSDETYEKLAEAASQILERPVNAAMLRGEKPWTAEIQVLGYVGAGDEILRSAVDGGLGGEPAPPGYEDGGAAIVRGDSMRPVFDDGDILFFRSQEPPIGKPIPKRPVIVQVRGGPLYVKRILAGSKRGLFHLLSINPVMPVLEDRPVESIARIGWVKPAE